MSTIRGLRCKPGFPLSHILQKWIRLNKSIAEAWSDDGDVPWWYNERAAISIFSGAVWKSGYQALEEFVDEKRKVAKKSGKFSRKYSGRVDLFLNIEGQDFIAEAKQCWSGASSEGADSLMRITKCLQRACSDIRKSRPHGQRRVALLFVVPYIRRSHIRSIDQRIQNWIKKVQSLECDASAWVFPACARRTKWEDYYCPGTAVFVKEV